MYPSRISGIKPPESVARIRGSVARGWFCTKTSLCSMCSASMHVKPAAVQYARWLHLQNKYCFCMISVAGPIKPVLLKGFRWLGL